MMCDAFAKSTTQHHASERAVLLFSFGGAEERDFERVFIRFATDFSRLNFQKHHAEEEKFLKNAGDESSKKRSATF